MGMGARESEDNIMKEEDASGMVLLFLHNPCHVNDAYRHKEKNNTTSTQ